MLNKILDNAKCVYSTALAWTVSAKNALINHNGFSPSQLVFGQNSNLSITINDLLSALEILVQSVDVAQHVTTLHTARILYISFELSEKLKVALQKNIRNYQKFYNLGMNSITNKIIYHNGKVLPKF